MDFKTTALGEGGLGVMVADTVLAVLAGHAVPQGLDPALSSIIKDALKSGDLELKTGRTLYVHRPAGFKAQRFVVTVAADDSAKSFRAGVSAGLSVLKGLGGAHVLVAQVGSARLTEAHAEAVATAVCDSVYTYRHRRRSMDPVRRARGCLARSG